MSLALLQADIMLGNTKHNPSVGCVITKNNNLISAGTTSYNGRPHAEVNAIDFSKYDLKKSTIYTTLEPCSHYGKTPPCVKKIMSKNIKRVFFSINDPDKRSYKKSKFYLTKKKIIVKKGLLHNEISSFYKSYFNSKKKDIPYVTSKIAISRDFFTINKNNKRWITNEYSRGRVHLLRSSHDCIVTSSTTVIDDNPKFTCRIPGLEKLTPSRVILDKNLETPLNCNLVLLGKKYRTIIFHCKQNKKFLILYQLNLNLYYIFHSLQVLSLFLILFLFLNHSYLINQLF